MDTGIVFGKTAKGEEELATRKHGLSMSLRRGLILVDGKSDVGKLIEKGVGVADIIPCLEELERGGFITRNRPAGTAPNSASVGDDVKARLIAAAKEILGDKDAEKVIVKIERAPSTKDALEETLAMCRKLVKLTIDEAKAEQLMARCQEILRSL